MGVTAAPGRARTVVHLAVVVALLPGGATALPALERADQEPAPAGQAADTSAGASADSVAASADAGATADTGELVDTGLAGGGTTGAPGSAGEFEWDRTTREPAQTWQLLLALFGLVLVIGAAVFAHQHLTGGRRRDPELDSGADRPLPPIVFPARPSDAGSPAPVNAAASASEMKPPSVSSSGAQPAPAARAAPAARPAAVEQPAPAAQPAPATQPARAAQPEATPIRAPVSPDADTEDPHAGETETGESVQSGPIRFHRPPEGTLQLLPGRLQIVSENERLEEIRFVKVSGHDAAVTFGRSDGRPHLHIQLESPTVSRMHATMRYRDGSWYLSNLSKTNPVIVNDRELSEAPSPDVKLTDGDRIEMGEVVFRFGSR